MFQYFRTGQVAFFVDMPDQDNRDPLVLGVLQDTRSTLTYLGYGAWRGLYLVGIDGLDGVYDDQLRLNMSYLVEDIFQVGIVQYQAVFMPFANPVSPYPDLFGALFPGQVKNFFIVEQQSDLQSQGGFSYARFTPDQHHGPWYKSPAKQTVKLLQSRFHPFPADRADLGNGL